MRKFLLNILYFLLSSFAVIAFLVLLTKYLAVTQFNFNIPKEKNTVILGNSHPECAIDDSQLPRAFNLSQSGSGYFYDYLKTKKLIAQNKQIDTLVIGYSYGDIAENMDSWFNSEEKIKFKIRDYFFLLEPTDYLDLLKANPLSTIKNTPQTILHNLKMSRRGLNGLGGYKHLTRNKLSEDIKRNIKSLPTKNRGTSEYQKNYLLKIYELCNTYNIKLVLLATPIHPINAANQQDLMNNYFSFANQSLPGAMLVDHSNFKLPDAYFADLAHLNFKGAKLYTQYLEKEGFREIKNFKKP